MVLFIGNNKMKKISLPKIDFHDFIDKIITHIKIIISVLFILIITGFGFFLYRDFYLTIISAQEIVILESEIGSTTIKTDLLESLEQKQKQKQSLIQRDWSKFKNIFYKSDNDIVGSNDADNADNFVQPRTTF